MAHRFFLSSIAISFRFGTPSIAGNEKESYSPETPKNAAQTKQIGLIRKQIRPGCDGKALAPGHDHAILSSGAVDDEEIKAVPSAYQLLAVCAALHLEDGFDYFVSNTKRPLLNAEGRRKVKEYREDLIASGKYREVPPVLEIRYLDMPVSDLPVSAGTGAFLDEGNFEMVSFPESSIPDGAEFGVRVSGDSMEPVYHDGQIVWVQQCETLRTGEVGVMIYDGQGYIKAYAEQEPDDPEAYLSSDGVRRMQPVMVSYNKAYAPKPASPELEFRIVGRVL